MASCNNLSKINGKFVGDPLEIILAEKSGLNFDDSGLQQKNFNAVISYGEN